MRTRLCAAFVAMIFCARLLSRDQLPRCDVATSQKMARLMMPVAIRVVSRSSQGSAEWTVPWLLRRWSQSMMLFNERKVGWTAANDVSGSRTLREY